MLEEASRAGEPKEEVDDASEHDAPEGIRPERMVVVIPPSPSFAPPAAPPPPSACVSWSRSVTASSWMSTHAISAWLGCTGCAEEAPPPLLFVSRGGLGSLELPLLWLLPNGGVDAPPLRFDAALSLPDGATEEEAGSDGACDNCDDTRCSIVVHISCTARGATPHSPICVHNSVYDFPELGPP